VAEYFGEQTMTRAFQDGLDLHLADCCDDALQSARHLVGARCCPLTGKAEDLMRMKDPGVAQGPHRTPRP
jgi:hypothetical protein